MIHYRNSKLPFSIVSIRIWNNNCFTWKQNPDWFSQNFKETFFLLKWYKMISFNSLWSNYMPKVIYYGITAVTLHTGKLIKIYHTFIWYIKSGKLTFSKWELLEDILIVIWPLQAEKLIWNVPTFSIFIWSFWSEKLTFL